VNKPESDDDITLIDTIRNISRRIVVSSCKAEQAHAEFLHEVMEDMQQQVQTIRRQRGLSSSS